jgi:LacI family transcriptional regulator
LINCIAENIQYINIQVVLPNPQFLIPNLQFLLIFRANVYIVPQYYYSPNSRHRMQQSTLKKLSEVLGISISTVSRALKDHPDIAEATKVRVKELAATMEYEPNNYAVQLRTRKSNVLGIMVPAVDNFFYDSFIAAIEEEARQHGYSVIILQSRHNTEIENVNMQLFRKSMVAGVFASVTTETEDMTPFLKMLEMKVPVVFFDRLPLANGFKKTSFADAAAARMAADAIISRNKKNILALFGDERLSIARIRSATLQQTITEKAPKAKLKTGYTDNIGASRDAAMAALQSKQRPDAIFCMSDLILIGVMHAIHDLQLRVPEDVSVITMSNGLIPTLYHPRITYVETNGYKLGKLAFTQMLASLSGEEYEPQELMLEPLLVEGGSL